MQLVGAALWGCCVCISPSLQITTWVAWESWGTDRRLRPTSQESTEIIRRMVWRQETCFAFLICFSMILIPWTEEMKWAVFCLSKTCLSKYSCIHQLKQANGWTHSPSRKQRLCPSLYWMLKQQSKHTVIEEQVDHMSPFNGKMSSVQMVTSWPSGVQPPLYYKHIPFISSLLRISVYCKYLKDTQPFVHKLYFHEDKHYIHLKHQQCRMCSQTNI